MMVIAMENASTVILQTKLETRVSNGYNYRICMEHHNCQLDYIDFEHCSGGLGEACSVLWSTYCFFRVYLFPIMLLYVVKFMIWLLYLSVVNFMIITTKFISQKRNLQTK